MTLIRFFLLFFLPQSHLVALIASHKAVDVVIIIVVSVKIVNVVCISVTALG